MISALTIRQLAGRRSMAARSSRMRGFSMLEVAIVLAVSMIAASITLIAGKQVFRQAKDNSAMETVVMQLRRARQLAIDERRVYQVSMTAPRTVTIQRYVGGVPDIIVSTTTLPLDIDFQVLPGVPANPAATPDGFGNAGQAIDLSVNVGGGGNNFIFFFPDGSAQDRVDPTGNGGNLTNGIVYMGRTGDTYSARAVTVFGGSGRVRAWRLLRNQSAGINYWKGL